MKLPTEAPGCTARMSEAADLPAVIVSRGFPGGSDGKESACNAGDSASISEFKNFPGEKNGYPLQYSGLENSMDRGAWQAIVHGVTVRHD